MNILLKTLLTTSLLAVAGSACAHAVWLERDAKGVHLYYGEYDEAKRESSPGRLDDLPRHERVRRGLVEIEGLGRELHSQSHCAPKASLTCAFPQSSG